MNRYIYSLMVVLIAFSLSVLTNCGNEKAKKSRIRPGSGAGAGLTTPKPTPDSKKSAAQKALERQREIDAQAEARGKAAKDKKTPVADRSQNDGTTNGAKAQSDSDKISADGRQGKAAAGGTDSVATDKSPSQRAWGLSDAAASYTGEMVFSDPTLRQKFRLLESQMGYAPTPEEELPQGEYNIQVDLDILDRNATLTVFHDYEISEEHSGEVSEQDGRQVVVSELYLTEENVIVNKQDNARVGFCRGDSCKISTFAPFDPETPGSGLVHDLIELQFTGDEIQLKAIRQDVTEFTSLLDDGSVKLDDVQVFQMIRYGELIESLTAAQGVLKVEPAQGAGE